MTRRRFLGRVGSLAGGLALAPTALASCGGGARSGAGSPSGANGSLVVENWPGSIDTDAAGDPARGETILGFEHAAGVAVEYRPTVRDNDQWFAAHRRELALGSSAGVDVVVLTGWMVEQLIGLGYVEELDASLVPNAANVVPELAHPDFDPDRRFSLPWTSRMAGIAYDPVRTDRTITSVADVLDPAFAGHVSLLPEARACFGLALLGLGIDPANCSVGDLRAAAATLTDARDRGQFRSLDEDGSAALVRGDTWLAYAWSDGIASIRAQNPGVRFVVPEQGGMMVTDNMVVPVGAVNADNAHAWIDHVYDPAVSARIHTATRSISPVTGTAERVRDLDPGLTVNPLMFPTVDVLQRLHVFRSLSGDEQTELAILFDRLRSSTS
jgi:spermidine/putrescine transport system substrate-binding protein